MSSFLSLHVLRAKFQLGLYENPFVDVERAVRLTNTPAHQQLAAEAARRSIVEMKRDDLAGVKAGS